MEKVPRTETQYYFEVKGRRWWVLSTSSDDWEELPNQRAYNLGLFKAVNSQDCEFIDTDLASYNEAIAEIIEGLERQLKGAKESDREDETNDSKDDTLKNEDGGCTLKPKNSACEDASDDQGLDEAPRDAENGHPEDSPTPVSAPKVPLPSKAPILVKKMPIPVKKAPILPKGVAPAKADLPPEEATAPILAKETPLHSEREQVETADATPARTSNLKNQISDLIASTSNMKECYRAQRRQTEPARERTTTLRSTARRLTYANNGGLAGCLKTVAEERGKMTPEFIKTRDNQLDKMMQRARSMAAKTMSSDKMKDAAEALRKGLQDGSLPTKPQGSLSFNRLRSSQNLQGVTFEASSDSSEDDGPKGMAKSPTPPPQPKQGMDQILAERPSIRRKTVVLNQE